MSRKRSTSDEGTGFLRKLAWTVLLALVFSAGLITGQRMIRSETTAPLVSVTSDATDSASEADSKSEQTDGNKEPLFSFYERLSEGGGSDTPTDAKPKNNDQAGGQQDESEPSDQAEAEPAADPQTAHDSDKPADDSEDSNEPPEEAATYTLQVSAYPSLDRARARIRALSNKGLDAHVVSAEVPDKGTYYRVHIGKFTSMDNAEKFQAELKKKRGVETFVTPL